MSDEEEDEESQPRCEQCGQRRATVHLTEFIDGEPVQRHLCEECYAEKEGHSLMTPTAIFAHILAAVAPELKELSTKRCPSCHTSYLEFRQKGLLGCPKDYEVFDKALSQLVEHVHGATKHCGKVPPQAGEQEVIRSRLRSLRRKQERAVSEEDYELAAELRDQIEQMEARADGTDGPEE